MDNTAEMMSEAEVFRTIEINIQLVDDQLELGNSEAMAAFLNGQRYALLSLKRSLEYR